VVQKAGLSGITTDWECLILARGGSESAWRILFRRHYSSLVRMTACITGSMDAGHDLAQESFVRLLHCRIQHQNGSFRAFLTTTAYRLALKEKRRAAAGRSLDDHEIETSEASPLEAAIRDETDKAVVRAIQSLPVHQREVLALRFFGGHSYEEIAILTELPVGTVKSRLFYAVKTCRERLRNEGVFT
jgi:RNA polymerase sigma factor (sigma-70 family)